MVKKVKPAAEVMSMSLRVLRWSASLPQMALAWSLRDPRMTSLVIGASSTKQLEQNVAMISNHTFTQAELDEIDQHAVEGGIDLWRAASSS